MLPLFDGCPFKCPCLSHSHTAVGVQAFSIGVNFVIFFKDSKPFGAFHKAVICQDLG